MYRQSITSLGIVLLALASTAQAEVRVLVGPTPIQSGDARAAGDITLVNEKLAITLAVESTVPYGVPRGAIVDVAPVRGGKIGHDQAVFADFIPNNWSSWPNTFQRVSIVERGPDQAVVRAERDWGKVTITTVYTLKSQADRLEIQTTMRNDGDAALVDQLSGLTLWPRGGYEFGVPGLPVGFQGKVESALADRFVAYDESWAVALHMDDFDHVVSGGKDLFRLHTLQPGESRAFNGRLQVAPSGDLRAVIQADIDRKRSPTGVVRGTVTDRKGAAVDRPVIVIEKQGHPYGWVIGQNGRYELTLPAGEYALYATAKFSSQSGKLAVTVDAGSQATRNFQNLDGPGRILFDVRSVGAGVPLDARIAITEGQKPLVQFLGRKVFFTELNARGKIEVPIAAGPYLFHVSAGGGFLGPSREIPVTVIGGQAQTVSVALQRQFDPTAQGWYSADLHHHADQVEAVTPPTDMVRSQLAAGLDLLFVSDHDSTVNHAVIDRIARRRGMPFIPSIELSPSWGHFNAYPLNPGAKLGVDTTTATADELFRDARRMGASILQSNHPFLLYGYLASLSSQTVPGGFNAGFDLLEINADLPNDDAKVLAVLWRLWNARHRVYLSAGTDTHDVWNERSGRNRVFAHLNGSPSAAAFAQALKDGHAYVSFGPLIFPSVMFGDTLKIKPGATFSLGFDIKSVKGLSKIELIGGGNVIKSESITDAALQEMHVDFALTEGTAGWYSLMVRDRDGNKAYTNPIWVDTLSDPMR